MLYPQCSQANVALRQLTKAAFLAAEVVIITAVVSVSITHSVRAESASPSSRPVASQQALKNPGLPANQPLEKVGNPAPDARKACYSGERADCVFSVSNTGKVQRFNGITDSLEIFATPANPPFQQVRLFELSF